MKIVHTILAALILIASPAFAAKHRASKHPSAGAAFQATVKGKVLDASTGNPITFATVTFGESRVTTNSNGEFQFEKTTGFGDAAVTATRTGYNASTQTVNGSQSTWDLTFRLQSRPTVTLKLTDGTSKSIDDDSVKFGYVVVFSGYVASELEDFCKPDGTQVEIPISAIKRITGPATMVTRASCCSHPAQTVKVELRSGETADLMFKDSCDNYTVDFLGREHSSAANVFAKFSEISEVVFP